MGRSFRRPFPSVDKQTRSLGERLKEARLRRSISTGLFAERMGTSRDTLNRLEKGDPTIALGTYLRALRILGLDREVDALARDDELGRKLQDVMLRNRRLRSTQPSAASIRSSDLIRDSLKQPDDHGPR